MVCWDTLVVRRFLPPFLRALSATFFAKERRTPRPPFETPRQAPDTGLHSLDQASEDGKGSGGGGGSTTSGSGGKGGNGGKGTAADFWIPKPGPGAQVPPGA